MCEHGFIGACATCDGSGQTPDWLDDPFDARCLPVPPEPESIAERWDGAKPSLRRR